LRDPGSAAAEDSVYAGDRLREASEAEVAVRNRKHGDQGAQNLDQFVANLKTLVESKAVSE